MHDGLDRRFFNRVAGEFAVRYMPHGASIEHFGLTKDISGAGVRIAIVKKMSPGTVLYLQIFKDETDCCAKCKGQVAWSYRISKRKREFEIGVRFLEADLLYIGNLISEIENKRIKPSGVLDSIR